MLKGAAGDCSALSFFSPLTGACFSFPGSLPTHLQVETFRLGSEFAFPNIFIILKMIRFVWGSLSLISQLGGI